MTKKTISSLIDASYRQVGLKSTVIFADHLMYTVSIMLLNRVFLSRKRLSDSKKKSDIIEQAEDEVRKIQAQFSSGLVTKVNVTIKSLIFGHVQTI